MIIVSLKIVDSFLLFSKKRVGCYNLSINTLEVDSIVRLYCSLFVKLVFSWNHELYKFPALVW